MMFSLFVSCPKGLEYLLEDELRTIGLSITRVSPQGVYGEADLALIYRLCLWSRLANRVQVILLDGAVCRQQQLYQLCREYAWSSLFSVDKTFAIEFHGASSDIRNSMFGAQVVKDAVVDHFREHVGERPVINKEHPDIRLHAYLKDETLTVSFDVTGYSLHQRGYRLQAGSAPLKENVAAAMLIRARWPQLAAEGYAFHDPFCGAGTLVIEAAMMAAHKAPGLLRHDQSFQHWALHDASLWDNLRTEAMQQEIPLTMVLQGSDTDDQLIKAASANAHLAGVDSLVLFQASSLANSRPTSDKGLLVCNPPYGERMGEVSELVPLYQQMGQVWHTHYHGWQVALLTAHSLLAKATGLRAHKQYTLYNGALECKVYCFTLDATNDLRDATTAPLSEGAVMLANRLQKNYAHLQKWAKREHVDCYRVYDADLPEYAYAIDIYQDYVVLQEYKAPAIIDAHKVEKRRLEVYQVVPQVLGIDPLRMIIKERKPQKGDNQYQKMAATGRRMVVKEGNAQLYVNLYDYLDTGLFLDHRPLRLRFEQLPKETRFLNCFCYTASASVHAALGGAVTTNVDLSHTYLDWATENFKLNRLDVSKHQFIADDVLSWLKKTRERFDVIFLDPPSFSNSKRMTGTLDILRDHESLIRAAMCLLYPGGVLYFSTNLRHFKISPQLIEEYVIRDISAQTIDVDFKRNPRIHQCFIIENS